MSLIYRRAGMRDGRRWMGLCDMLVLEFRVIGIKVVAPGRALELVLFTGQSRSMRNQTEDLC